MPWAIAGPFAVLITVMVAVQPYLSITERSGGDVLVVEGWMEEPELRQAFQIATDTRYHHLYTTGTVRPFAYYLRDHEGLIVPADSAIGRHLRIHVSGTGSAGFSLMAGGDTLLHAGVSAAGQAYDTELPVGSDTLWIRSWNTAPNDPTAANIFILYLRVDDRNVHELRPDPLFVRADGSLAPAWPTYADRARGLLVDYGMAPERITAVPGHGRLGRRSWSNATSFATQARKDGVQTFDIVTVGVHARRSRNLYRKACGPGATVGVISIPDPFCRPDNWWRTWRGFATLLKEIIGLSEGPASERTG